MKLRFDPGDGEAFKEAIQAIPGYPAGEDLPIRAMVFEAGALDRLPTLLRLAGAQPDQPVLVVMDRTPMRRGADDLKPLVLARLAAAGWQAQPAWLEAGGGQVHTDWHQIGQAQAVLRPGMAVLSVGSGTVTDVAKHAAFVFAQSAGGARVPLVTYATANSVSAYASNMAPVFVEGVKRTLPSRYPDVLVCDLETLRDAPMEMTVAGVGDLLAAFNSYADWYLAYRLGIDSSYTEFAETLMGPLDEIFLAQAEAIRAGSLEATATLAKLITLGGLAMSLSHATAPMSGYEHLVSHLLDLLAETSGRPLAQHGTQVALATALTTQAYQVFLAEFEPEEVNLESCYPSAAHMQARVEAAFGPLDPTGRAAAECWADYRLKLERWHQQRGRFEQFLAHWPAERAALERRLRSAEQVRAVLRAVGGPQSFAELTPPPRPEQVRFAFEQAALIRRRLTLADLFVFLNWDHEALWRRVGHGADRAA